MSQYCGSMAFIVISLTYYFIFYCRCQIIFSLSVIYSYKNSKTVTAAYEITIHCSVMAVYLLFFVNSFSLCYTIYTIYLYH